MNTQPPSYDEEQYAVLKECSESKDPSKWNEWRRSHPKEPVNLAGADLTEFNLDDIHLTSANMEGVTASRANLRRALLVGCNLRGCNLRGANLHEALLNESDLRQSDLTGAASDLGDITLDNAGLCDVKIQHAKVENANLDNTNIHRAHFEDCNFADATFCHAHIEKTSFSESHLVGAAFDNAIVHSSVFRRSSLTNASFAGADFSDCDFWYAEYNVEDVAMAGELSGAKFLSNALDDHLPLRDRGILFCYEKHYNLLLECSLKRDLSPWNELNPSPRTYHSVRRIHLAGAEFDGAFLRTARLWNADLRGVRFVGTDLTGARLQHANLDGAYMNNSPRFDHANMHFASLRGASLGPAIFRGAFLFGADLSDANLGSADFTNADFREAILSGTKGSLADFSKARLSEADFRDAYFYKCNFSGVDLRRVVVSSSTRFYQCEVDGNTDFRGVPLDGIGVDAATKRILQYNTRRKNWDDWYWRTTWPDEKRIFVKRDSTLQTIWSTLRKLTRCIVTLPVRIFWWTSNYGVSLRRILYTFFASVLLFSVVQYADPTCMNNLLVTQGTSSKDVTGRPPFIRAVYSSIVTMTTLGLGDIHAAPRSTKGHLLVIAQTLCGYVLLAELVTYLGILFTTGGPFLIYTFQGHKVP